MPLPARQPRPAKAPGPERQWVQSRHRFTRTIGTSSRKTAAGPGSEWDGASMEQSRAEMEKRGRRTDKAKCRAVERPGLSILHYM